MYDKAVDNYAHTLEFFLIAIRLKKMCNKEADTYASTKRSFSECYKTQENV